MSAPRKPAVVVDHVVVPAGTTCADAVAAGRPAHDRAEGDRGGAGRGRAAARPGLDPEVEQAEVEPVAIDSPDGLTVLRHSTAHVAAQAVQDLFPEAKLGIGPPIENGFYYDFAVPKPFQPDDLAKIEKRMQDIVKAGQLFRRRRFDSIEDARAELAARAVQAGAGRPQVRCGRRPR